MSESLDTIAAEASQLPPDQRLTLAFKMLSSLEPEKSSSTDEAWDVEIRGRIAGYDAGASVSIPAAEVFSEIDRILSE